MHSVDEIVETVKAMAKSFGGINLEDIAAPQCFEIEDRLAKELSIPVFHDDQHGTAIIILAGLINALKLADKELNKCQIALVGSGAAGVATINLIKQYAPGANIIAVDSKGIVSRSRTDLNHSKQQLLEMTNKDNKVGGLAEAVRGADIFIGVSSPDILSVDMVRTMNKHAIIFAMANPDPEIRPDKAKEGGAFIVATGRSDYPNQINNALVFPGIFRGALDHNIKHITYEHKIKAAEAIAGLVKDPTPDMIIPSISDERLVTTVSAVIT